jgi:Tfp pilus assembly protein PilO
MKAPDFSNLGNTFKGLKLSIVEIVALVSALIFAAIVLALYFNSIQPIKNKIAELETRKKQLTGQANTEIEKNLAIKNQRTNAQKILDSLESFESRLRHRKQGIPDVINEVNQLARAYKVRAGDISFQTASAEQLAGDGANPTPTPAITRRDKLPNVYEGLGINTTVEGDYHDLRRFISALERSRNFVIVNAISLQSIDEKNKQKGLTESAENVPGQPPLPPGVRGVPVGAVPAVAAPTSFPTKVTVSLKIEMETHFAREGAVDNSLAKPIPAVAPPVNKLK